MTAASEAATTMRAVGALIGIEQTTDLRHPDTVIVRLRSRTAAESWARRSGGYAWEGSADESLPVQRQNWHHKFRAVYEMPVGWREPTKKQIEAMRGLRPWEDRRRAADIRASMIRAAGRRVEFVRAVSP